MSALQFLYTPNGDGPCMEYGCPARCRYTVLFMGRHMGEAGWDLEDLKLCKKHMEAAEKTWIGALDSEITRRALRQAA